MKTKLTKDQSDHLMSLGIKFPDKVAIHNGEMAIGPCKDEYPDPNGWYIPISITDLLEILPKEIEYEGEFYMIETFWNKLEQGWCAWYRTAEMMPLCLNQDIINNPTFIETELIDALYELACWYYEREKQRNN